MKPEQLSHLPVFSKNRLLSVDDHFYESPLELVEITVYSNAYEEHILNGDIIKRAAMAKLQADPTQLAVYVVGMSDDHKLVYHKRIPIIPSAEPIKEMFMVPLDQIIEYEVRRNLKN